VDHLSADKVFLSGQVVTVDENDSVAEAIAVKGNRIIAVGSNTEVEGLIGDSTKVFNLHGKSLLPGFIDSHMHISLYGAGKFGIDCKEPHIESIHDILADIKSNIEQVSEGEWVRAWGFNNTKVAEQRYPTRWELDEVSTEHPILIVRTDGHISIANSKALELSGINENTPDPDGGRIERNQNGVPTGVLIETAHMRVMEFAKYSEQELFEALAAASDDLVASGITSLHDAGGFGAYNLRVMQQAVQSGDVKVRIYALICALTDAQELVEQTLDSGITTGLGNEKYKIGPVKLFTDGSSSGPTIATREPYTSDSNNYGILYYEQDQLNHILGKAHERGFQITAHAQGDRAIEMVIDCIETALDSHPRQNHRHRIEHAGLTMPDLLDRMKELNIIPIPNPAFFYEFGDGYIENYGDRVDHMFPAKDFLAAGMPAAAGSDSPVTDYNPLLGIHVAVNRRSQSGNLVGESQRVSVMEAIRLFTWNGAYASFDEDIKGSIEVGKLADLVVLSDQILSVPDERIKELEVEMTLIDGEVLFEQTQ
jgi:predicted amidohydrolase YtcJ